MLSAATPFNQFWTQVYNEMNTIYGKKDIFYTIESISRSTLFFQGYNLHIPNLDVLGSFFETTVRIFYRG